MSIGELKRLTLSPAFDGPIINWGKFSFLLHDNGWWIATDSVIRVSASWPTTGYRMLCKAKSALNHRK